MAAISPDTDTGRSYYAYDALLTSADFVRAHTSISDNVDGKYILPAIRKAQETNLKQIIGSCLLNTLKEAVESGGGDERYAELLERCQYYLAALAAMEVIPKVSYKIGNFGLVRSTDENLQSATATEIAQEMQRYRDEADTLARDLQTWLLENKDAFPELTECDCARIHANLYSSASCGINLGGARGKRIRR